MHLRTDLAYGTTDADTPVRVCQTTAQAPMRDSLGRARRGYDPLRESGAPALARLADANRGVGPWAANAACRGVDPELFFPPRGAPLTPAKAVCRDCPVREACLEYALAAGESYGVWGGRSEQERRRIRSRRSMLAARGLVA